VLVSYSSIKSAEDTIQWASTEPRAISYSPFPAEPGIEPVSQDFAFPTVPVLLSEGVVETEEPLAHIQRTFEISNLHLSDFEKLQMPVSP
jgi:hypothetical protein